MTNQPHLLPDEPTLTGPVTCLGLTFADDAARRAHFTELLRRKLQDPAFRAIEGFPIGTDEAILALSDPPYYTACPNPWIGEFIAEWQGSRGITNYELRITNEEGASETRHSSLVTRNYHREPFAADVSEGKNDPIYNAHSYHTKVPHKAIMRYILHYTEPGDIVFDGFCGTGMTGVAAQLCGDRKEVESLGYRVDGDGVVYDGERAISRLGARRAVLNDLSPAATFIAYNYNTPVDVAAFEREAKRILKEVEEELGWMYETWHPHCDDPGRVKGKIRHVVWSDVFLCPQCTNEIVFWNQAIDEENAKVRESFPCPNCHTAISKTDLSPSLITQYDSRIDNSIRQIRRQPVVIDYLVGSRRYKKSPDLADYDLVTQIEAHELTDSHNTYPMMLIGSRWGDSWRAGYHVGITHSHHFYSKRNLQTAYSFIAQHQDIRYRALLTAVTSDISRMARVKIGYYFKGGGGPFIPGLSGTLYVPSISVEKNPIFALENRVQAFVRGLPDGIKNDCVIETSSASELSLIPRDSFDYIFTDPPFGGNLMYSELNFLWEAWLEVFTNNNPEAIQSSFQNKRLIEYQQLMTKAFQEYFQVLKPGRWMTVEFHNSQNNVWNAIQEAIFRAGFIIADVRTLDKQQGSFKQVQTTSAVKQDLVISAYKPNGGLEERFALLAGTADGAWEFVRRHLAQLPVAVEADGGLEQVAERQDYLLFDRMVAFHIQRGAAVPLSAAEFYAGLRRRFDERDGMFFLKEQIPAYDAARLRAGQPAQLALFVSDEKSSIQWLRQQLDPALGGRPQTYQEIQPGFLRGLHQAAHEALPELRDLLADNFLQDEGGRWHAPDPNKAEDLERLRRRALLAEFESYLSGKGRLKQFRTEAVRAGFADAWRRKEFDLILKVAERLPERVIQEDPDLLMYYDTASLRN